MMLLALALVCMPAAGFAQELPDLFTAVYEGIGEGLAQAAKPIGMQMQEELTLALSTEDGRIEEGKTMPWNAVYDEFCVRNNVPVGNDIIGAVKEYERDILSKR